MSDTPQPAFPPAARPQPAAGSASPSLQLVDLVNRRHQMFPVLGAAEIARLRRFGHARAWAEGEPVVTAGSACAGLIVLTAGAARISRDDGAGRSVTIVEHGVGEFIGDIGQLSGSPSMIAATALSAIEALVVPAPALRALLIAEAELGARIMRALILRRANLLETGECGPLLVGAPASAGVVALQAFLTANAVPHTLFDPDTSDVGAAALELHAVAPGEQPLVLCPGGQVLKNPTLLELGRCIGLMPVLDGAALYDLLVIGAGPAGLAAAVYAASEGLSVMVLEQHAYGGQAGTSSRIENYLGFPTGISGAALAGRAFIQAQKFGVELAVPAAVHGLDVEAARPVALLADGSRVAGRALVIASGARYRRPDLPDIRRFEGAGVYYAASPIEAKLCRAQPVILVGGGNSAGQAAVYLARYAAEVRIVIRAASLEASMSRYLIERIAATPNIVVQAQSEIAALEGEEGGGLRAVLLRARSRGEIQGETQGELTRHALRHVFLMIGADPNTDWLAACALRRDASGFILTGGAAGSEAALGTSAPGIFAIGDVRSGSTKRVAAAVGEGAAVVAQVHAWLAQQ